MKWIDKIKGLFNDDEENEVIPSTKNPPHINNISHKTIDTKVTYQYPKGQFRFPLIPDGSNEKAQVIAKRRNRAEQTKPVEKQQPTRFQSKDNHESKTPNLERKQPFRPTEIPSAVHGFKPPTTKPMKEEPVIEFELSSVDHHHRKHTLDLRNGYEEASATIEVEKEHPTAIKMEEKVDSFVENQTVKEDNTNAPIEQTVDISDLLTKLQIEDDVETEGDFEQVDSEEEQPLVHSKEEVIELEAVEELDNKVEDVEEMIEPALEQQQVEQKHRTERTGRRPIPFNVLMLKKDREKQQVQKQNEKSLVNRIEDRQQVEPVRVEQNVVVQEQVTREGEHQNLKSEESIQRQEPIKTRLEEQQPEKTGYTFPSLSLLNQQIIGHHEDENWVENQRMLLDEALKSFKVRAHVVNVTQGPAVTRFEVQPEPGVKVNKITNLSDDIKLNLSAKEIRIEAPIPGKNTIGIEVPNKISKPVFLHEIVNSPEFINSTSPLTVALGLDISGTPIITDLNKMPHGLIAGATGSGKSVCINTMLVSLMYKAAPHEVKLLLIDPKMVELAPYNHIPHLVSPVITDVKAATAALKWAVEEMERRYELFAHSGVRDISRYNEMVEKHQEQSGKLPFLVIIIDELADLMMVAPGEVEEAICRIAQKARACGIHLILATQRPSVDVITGLIKANIPTRIAFSVSSQVDSRTIIDSSGAEKLLGKGDMLFLENGSSKPKRVQGNFVSDEEIDRVVSHVKQEVKPSYLFQQDELIKKSSSMSGDDDELFPEACEFVVEQGGASTSSVQRRFRIGYNRAARLIDMMEEQGIISEARGSKPREILISEEELNNIQEN
ncbi:DNA translocase FtsK [Bacillus sp. PS06]|uniref:DNA translocase FtsK n=1 Tax=Bacillus sp. PS06 TaxID=2764176 RepID=UPI0017809752|nr:DNA translocase FtsK [Bacillus sp. PS06]MBD8069006.1 DNA translocase FtsK [Bacillus sp. PS06]